MLLLVACTRANYVYVVVDGENIEVMEVGKPPLGYWRFGGDPIAIRYALKEPGISLTLAVGNEAFVPSFEIVSSVPIHAVSVGKSGHAIRRSEFEYRVSWSFWRDGEPLSLRVGDVVQIAIDLENRPDPVLISGVIAESGVFFF
jgi:hypothetical protein